MLACTELEYLLQRLNGFKIFCDHANLTKIFCPAVELKQYVRGKLQRWATKITSYNFDIEHIIGTDNVWADIVSKRILVEPANESIVVNAVRTRSQPAMNTLRPL